MLSLTPFLEHSSFWDPFPAVQVLHSPLLPAPFPVIWLSQRQKTSHCFFLTVHEVSFQTPWKQHLAWGSFPTFPAGRLTTSFSCCPGSTHCSARGQSSGSLLLETHVVEAVSREDLHHPPGKSCTGNCPYPLTFPSVTNQAPLKLQGFHISSCGFAQRSWAKTLTFIYTHMYLYLQ